MNYLLVSMILKLRDSGSLYSKAVLYTLSVTLDTIHFYLPTESIGNGSFIQTMPNLLTNQKILIDKNGFTSIYGNLDNLKVTVSDRGLKVKGSIAKFYQGNNYSNFTRQDLKWAIEELSCQLGVNVGKGNLTRFDVAHNLSLNYGCSQYFDLLLDSPRYERLRQPDAVYWQNKTIQKLVYDKIKEAKKSGEVLPETVNNMNLFRYEVRFIQNPKRVFKRDSLKVSDLINEPFYMEIQDRWLNEFANITKHEKQIIMPMKESIKTPADYFEYCLMNALNDKGYSEALKEVDSIDGFTKMNRSRTKRKILDLITKSKSLVKEDLIQELNKKAEMAIMGYR